MMIVPSRHLGNTRSRKAICAYDTRDPEYIQAQIKEFDKADHFDAFALFQFLALRAMRQYGEHSDEAEQMEFMSDYHRDQMSDEFLSKEKKLLALVTSIDICNYGESCIKHILRK
ncbi:MAG: hypothetical protein HQK54_00930 [Oligoflexales bacterium]|nr:hypothetical protein [Oligoflexales bacterium]